MRGLLALKMEWDHELRNSGSFQNLDSPLGPPGGKTFIRLLTYLLRICVVLSHPFVVISYSSNRKLMQYVWRYSLKFNVIRLFNHKNRLHGDFHKLKDIYIYHIYVNLVIFLCTMNNLGVHSLRHVACYSLLLLSYTNIIRYITCLAILITNLIN